MSNQVKCKVNVQLKARVKRATPPERLMPDTPQLNKQQTHHRQMVTNNSELDSPQWPRLLITDVTASFLLIPRLIAAHSRSFDCPP